jgi:SAM-dependent methyltransferase/uncharacterized protein YbaR (Trm112 family)
MKTTPFLCLACCNASLVRTSEQLTCPACGAVYPLREDVPILLPSGAQQETVLTQDGSPIALDPLRALYDRVYEHDGLMGTDLDGTYDRVTKETLLGFARPLAGKRLLDVGTGTGNLWGYVPAGVEGYALDISATGVRRAAQRYPELTVSVSTAEFLPYPDGFFDAVVAADTVEHTFSPSRTLQEIRRVLRADGVLGASFPVPNSLRKWGWNQLVHKPPDLGLFLRLIRVLVKRTLLFGRPVFQPLDRDYSLEDWIGLLETSGFRVETLLPWPEPPRLPIVTLIKAIPRD